MLDNNNNKIFLNNPLELLLVMIAMLKKNSKFTFTQNYNPQFYENTSDCFGSISTHFFKSEFTTTLFLFERRIHANVFD